MNAVQMVNHYAAQQNLDHDLATWKMPNGFTYVYEWHFYGKTVAQLDIGFVQLLDGFGITLYNVDTSRAPYYYVAARLVCTVELPSK